MMYLLYCISTLLCNIHKCARTHERMHAIVWRTHTHTQHTEMAKQFLRGSVIKLGGLKEEQLSGNSNDDRQWQREKKKKDKRNTSQTIYIYIFIHPFTQLNQRDNNRERNGFNGWKQYKQSNFMTRVGKKKKPSQCM